MNALELTEKYYQQKAQIKNLQETVDYLEQEVKRLRMFYEDLKVDVQMLERIRK